MPIYAPLAALRTHPALGNSLADYPPYSKGPRSAS